MTKRARMKSQFFSLTYVFPDFEIDIRPKYRRRNKAHPVNHQYMTQVLNLLDGQEK